MVSFSVDFLHLGASVGLKHCKSPPVEGAKSVAFPNAFCEALSTAFWILFSMLCTVRRPRSKCYKDDLVTVLKKTKTEKRISQLLQIFAIRIKQIVTFRCSYATCIVRVQVQYR